MEKRVLFRSAWLPWVLLLPQLAVISIFFFWPAGQALVQSFQMQDAFGMSTEWVGFDNFRTLFEDPGYLASFKTTAFFSIAVAVSGISISLVLAIFADRIVRGALVYKTALLLPYAVAPAVAGVLWMFMFSPSLGVVAYLLRQSGMDWNHLLNSDHAMTLIVIAAVWKQISYNFLFFLAGLQSIPKSLIEAAAIDGAGPWRRFWSIQFPLLSPTTFFLLVINVVYAFFDTFAIVDSTTQGGPGQDTSILVYKVYHDGFKAMDMGGSAAQSVVLMAIVVVLTVIQFRYVEKKAFSHLIMVLGVIIVGFPLYLAFVASTHTAQDIVQVPMPMLPGGNFWETYKTALFGGGTGPGSSAPVAHMMWVSFVTAMVITVGKIAISLLSAFAIVYFRFPFKGICFWLIFITLMLPVEVRIGPTYQVVSNLGMLNTYAGLTVPLIASATATFLFRQFFLTVPDELVEAARIDGAGPLRFFKDILVPLSRTSIAALFVIQFIYGWNQYLWPLLVTTSEDMYPVVIGIKRMIAGGDTGNEWNVVMATALLAMLPPALVVVF
eukprot:gene16863-16678_t